MRGGGGEGQEKLIILYNLLQMIQDELAEKDVERPVNLRNVDRSLFKESCGWCNEVKLVFLTPKISVKPEAYNPEAYNSVPKLGFFWEPIKI